MAGDLSRVPALLADIETEVVGDDVLVFDGTALTLLTGRAAAVARRVDGIRSTASIARAAALSEDQVAEELAALASRALVALGELAPDDAYRRPDHVGVCHDKQQAVLLDLRDGERHVLSPTAVAIWDALMGTGTLSGAVAELEAAYPDTAGLADDVAAFVNDLESQGLVERP